MKKIIYLTLLLTFSCYFYSCSSVTDISGTWKKPGTIAQKYNKIAVLGLGKSRVNNSTIENAVISNLRTYGITAVSGSNILTSNFLDADGDGKVDDGSKEKIADKLKEAGVDGALVLSLQDVKKSEQYVPGTSFYTPYAGFYGFNSYYWGAYNTINTPGYYTTTTNYFISSNFYNMKDLDLIWSAQSETLDPQSVSDFAGSYAPVIAQTFASAGIVSK
ncbi:MAG TPA: hypothetical protein PKA90_00695 [Ignavibacteria bacterium]|nr:hypothetical protein [Ignavibacteria bacterium]HMR38923.1 hypothetical protein [Ignavibacteria bacterium]